MHPLPRDVADLRLAPVALQLDAQLETFGRLDASAVALRVAFDTDRIGTTAEQRARDVVTSLTRLLNLHGWQVAWEQRGIRLSQGEHALVLGVPPVLRGHVERGA
jgi:hypothetical protein